jgi:probable F420-dependent oxidoreductase
MPAVGRDPRAWLDELRRIEDLGFDSVAISEHLTGGWSMDALAVMAAAALATSRLRLLSLVLSNEFRHPVLLHRAAATIDVLSNGRLELGLGTGWLAADFTASGLPLPPIGTRVDRLAEALSVVKALFGPAPVTFAGAHYQLHDLPGLPHPVQQPHPPILIGGGGPRLLRLAAREADIVGIHARLDPAGIDPAAAAADLGAEAVAEKVGWVRAELDRVGRPASDVELQFSVYLTRIEDSGRAAAAARSSFGAALGADPRLVAHSPAVLVGSVDRCVELLEERRELYGLSYWHLGHDVDAAARIVSRLSGT